MEERKEVEQLEGCKSPSIKSFTLFSENMIHKFPPTQYITLKTKKLKFVA
jgi:hypothetical protein